MGRIEPEVEFEKGCFAIRLTVRPMAFLFSYILVFVSLGQSPVEFSGSFAADMDSFFDLYASDGAYLCAEREAIEMEGDSLVTLWGDTDASCGSRNLRILLAGRIDGSLFFGRAAGSIQSATQIRMMDAVAGGASRSDYSAVFECEMLIRTPMVVEEFVFDSDFIGTSPGRPRPIHVVGSQSFQELSRLGIPLLSLNHEVGVGYTHVGSLAGMTLPPGRYSINMEMAGSFDFSATSGFQDISWLMSYQSRFELPSRIDWCPLPWCLDLSEDLDFGIDDLAAVAITTRDANGDGVVDSEPFGSDARFVADALLVFDEALQDCDQSGFPDEYEISLGVLIDADGDGIPDICQVAECPADLDADGTLTIFDFLAFQNLFDAGDPLADFDLDGTLTIFDFLAFQNAFDAGCP